jgi:hypothetical protein
MSPILKARIPMADQSTTRTKPANEWRAHGRATIEPRGKRFRAMVDVAMPGEPRQRKTATFDTKT